MDTDIAWGDDQEREAAPGETSAGPTLEIEFEIVSYVRPRSFGLISEDAASVSASVQDAATRHRVVAPDDDALMDIVLWAYYEACRRSARGERELPWESSRPGWRSFEAALRGDPDRPWWWSDPEERLARAREVFARLDAQEAHPGGRSIPAAPPPSRQARSKEAPPKAVGGAPVPATPAARAVTVRHAPAPGVGPVASARPTLWRWDPVFRQLRGAP